MSSKRTRNDADEYPSKKRHVGANNVSFWKFSISQIRVNKNSRQL